MLQKTTIVPADITDNREPERMTPKQLAKAYCSQCISSKYAIYVQ